MHQTLTQSCAHWKEEFMVKDEEEDWWKDREDEG